MSRNKSVNPDKANVLIAEDEEIGIFTIRLMLEHKYNLFFAKNGAEAVEKYFELKPDIVLMDIMMPEMDGFEAFTQIIKKRNAADQTKIIAVTARAMKEEKENIMQFGFDDYVSKPINDEELIEKLNKHIS